MTKYTQTCDYVLGLVARGTVMSLGDLMSALTQHTDGGKDSCGVENENDTDMGATCIESFVASNSRRDAEDSTENKHI